MLAMLDTLAKAGHTAQVTGSMRQKMAMFTPLPMKLRNGSITATLYRTHLVSSAERSHRAKGQFDSEGLMDLSKLEGRSAIRQCSSISAARLASCSFRETVSGFGRETGKHSLRMLCPHKVL